MLLGLLAATVLGWAAVAAVSASSLPAWVATTLLVADVVLILVTAPARSRQRRAARTAARAAARPARSAVRAQRRVVASPVLYDEAEHRVAPDAEPASDAVRASSPRRSEPDGTWTPVPVPLPTYALKPVVRRYEPAPEPEPEPEVGLAPTLDLDAVLARRRAVNG